MCHKTRPQKQESHGWQSAVSDPTGWRYHARVVVPERLRSILKKVELSASLGADRREALRKFPSVVARFHAQIAEAERGLGSRRKPLKSREALLTG
ncbi:DUF6538 domain-containing protein [Bradyrhizobium japonicum]|uniref:DUF6538 domain-containing protein n=1 Tax=Bradyrhizobium japonicum TaxID=375 RepID=UPI003D9C607A